MLKSALVLAVVTFLAAIAQAQTGALTDQQIQAAIDQGRRAKVKDVGLTVKPSFGSRFLRNTAVSILFEDTKEGWDGFALQIYTPAAWVALAAAKAQSLRLPFTPSEVTPEMRRSVVRIFVKPHAQTLIIRNANTSVTPVGSSQCTEPTYIDGVIARHCMAFEFSVDAVRAVMSREFTITVQMLQGVLGNDRGEGKFFSRDFNVEQKDLNKLPM